MEKWLEIQAAGDADSLAAKHGISPITARILLNRGINEEGIGAFLSPSLDDFHDPFMLSGMERVVSLLKEAISEGRKIRIIGDYDVDGISSTYILYRGFRYFGGDVDCVIPHRIADGYGLNVRLIDKAHENGRELIVTCDNGIAAANEIKHAHDLGIRVIVTDHHEVPYVEENGEKHYIIPEAEGVIDPKLPDDDYPFKGICGAFVAYKVIQALGYREGVDSDPAFMDMIRELTEIAAMATVCDVMELRDENRSLVALGAGMMSASKNAGIRALMEETSLKGKAVTPYHLGFVIGPCLNASGRLDSPIRSLALLAETDPGLVKTKARELKELNEARKKLTQEWTEKAFEAVDAKGAPDKVIVVYLKGCHESLAGIIAGKVREKYVRPTYILTDAENGLKGSGRSIEAYDMYGGLVKASALLTKFGGHKLAAGVSLDPSNLEAFRQNLNDNAELTEDDFVESVRVDVEVPFASVDMALVRELNRLAPYGVGNPTPIFKTKITIISGSYLGKEKNFAKYKVMDDKNHTYEMVSFGKVAELTDYVAGEFGESVANDLHSGKNISIPLEVLYTADINSFRGTESVQYQLKHFRQA